MDTPKTTPPPAFIVNPSLAPTRWLADPWQLRAHRNPNYLNSVWLGTVNQVLNFPDRLWHEFLRPLLSGRLFHAFVGFWAIALLIPAFLLLGLLGWLRAIPIDLETLLQAHVLSTKDSQRAIEAGMSQMLVRVADLPS